MPLPIIGVSPATLSRIERGEAFDLPTFLRSLPKNMFPETDNNHEALRLLDLIDAEFRSDPMSVQCFDARVVERVRQCVEMRKRLERRGEVPPLLSSGAPRP